MKRKALLLFAVTAIILALSQLASAQQSPQLWLNGPAPGFTLKDAAGKKVSLSGYKGSTVILAFWHPESQASIDQLKSLKTLLANKKYSSIKVLTITSGKEANDRAAAKKKFAEAGLSFPVVFEDRMDTSSTNVQYEVWYLPAFYIVNRSGLLSSPLISAVTEKEGGKSFGDFLLEVDRGKKTDACAFTPAHQADPDYKPLYSLIGKPAPNFIAMDAVGQNQSPSYYKGFKKVLLVFWKPDCPHCRRELPLISNYAKKWAAAQGVQIIAVCTEDDPTSKKAARDFFKQLGISFPLVFNDGEKITTPYNIRGVPAAFLIDKKGIIRDIYVAEFSMPADVIQCNMGKLK